MTQSVVDEPKPQKGLVELDREDRSEYCRLMRLIKIGVRQRHGRARASSRLLQNKIPGDDANQGG